MTWWSDTKTRQQTDSTKMNFQATVVDLLTWPWELGQLLVLLRPCCCLLSAWSTACWVLACASWAAGPRPAWTACAWGTRCSRERVERCAWRACACCCCPTNSPAHQRNRDKEQRTRKNSTLASIQNSGLNTARNEMKLEQWMHKPKDEQIWENLNQSSSILLGNWDQLKPY